MMHPLDYVNRTRDQVKGLREIVNALINSPDQIDMALHVIYYALDGMEEDMEKACNQLNRQARAIKQL